MASRGTHGSGAAKSAEKDREKNVEDSRIILVLAGKTKGCRDPSSSNQHTVLIEKVCEAKRCYLLPRREHGQDENISAIKL
ncbi:MAG: hypothetical protein LQ346_005920 [Caloplaca aetnensis]|nr:MAG: hypothetical protein LQ346_005920 [Caloplaca aetnensis]